MEKEVMNRIIKAAVSHKYFDIAANLADQMFTGVYHGKHAHPNDLDAVLKRADGLGVDR
jgi:TatD DNase family protein